MRSWRAPILVVALLLFVVAVLLEIWMRAGRPERDLSQPRASAVLKSPPPAAPAPAAPSQPTPPRADRPTASALPAGAVELAKPPAPPAAGLKPLTSAPEGRPMPVDRRGGPSTPRAQRALEILSYGFETLDEDIQSCLDQWPAATTAPKEVMIGFELDKSGLTRSFLENADDVPLGPRSCLANAVYGIDWSNVVDDPAQVTKRFTLEPRDGGAPTP